MEEHRRIPPQVGPPSSGNAAKTRHGRAVGIPASGHRNGVSGARGGGDIWNFPPEHQRPVYCDSSNTRVIPGGRIASRSMGIMAMVGARLYRPRPRIEEDGVAGDGVREGGQRGNGGDGGEERCGVRGDARGINESDRVM